MVPAFVRKLRLSVGQLVIILLISVMTLNFSSCTSNYLKEGKEFLGTEQYQKAIYRFDKAIEQDPYDGEAYLLRGLCYYNKKQYNKAIPDFSKIVELSPSNPGINFLRGNCFIHLKQYHKAISDYTRAIELGYKEGIYKVYNNRGMAYYNLNQYNKAVKGGAKPRRVYRRRETAVYLTKLGIYIYGRQKRSTGYLIRFHT